MNPQAKHRCRRTETAAMGFAHMSLEEMGFEVMIPFLSQNSPQAKLVDKRAVENFERPPNYVGENSR